MLHFLLHTVHEKHSSRIEILAAQHLLVRQKEELVCCAAMSAAMSAAYCV